MTVDTSDEKICPSCGETVRAQAKICRFCRHDFSASLDASGRGIPVRLLSVVGVVLVVGAAAFILVTKGEPESEIASVSALPSKSVSASPSESVSAPASESVSASPSDGDSAYESAGEIVDDLEEAGIVCEERHYLSESEGPSDPRLSGTEAIACISESVSFTVYLVDPAGVNGVLTYFVDLLADSGGPAPMVFGPNWVVTADDEDDAAERIREVLGGRIFELPTGH